MKNSEIMSQIMTWWPIICLFGTMIGWSIKRFFRKWKLILMRINFSFEKSKELEVSIQNIQTQLNDFIQEVERTFSSNISILTEQMNKNHIVICELIKNNYSSK